MSPEHSHVSLEQIKARLAQESGITPRPDRQERKKRDKVRNLLLTAIFKASVLTGCTPEIVDHRPVPITEIVPPSQEATNPRPEFVINGTPISEFPYYPSGDEVLVNPPELSELDQAHYDAVADATCMVMFIKDYDGTFFGNPIAGVLTEGGYVLTSKHLIEDDDGNSKMNENSALIVFHPTGMIANAGTEVIKDPKGQDIIAIKVKSFEDLPYLPIDTTPPKVGTTILQSSWHRFKEVGLTEPDLFRVIYGGTDPEDVNRLLSRGALDATIINKSEPGSSGGPMYNPETRAVFAINAGQLGHMGENGLPNPKYQTERVVVDGSGKAVTEKIDPIDVAYANSPSQELIDIIRSK